MNKLLVQQSNHKFIQNLSYTNIDNTMTMVADIANNLYKYFYHHSFTHCIFKAELLTPEIMQFIADFSSSQIKCIIHHNILSEDIVKHYEDYNVSHICHSTNTNLATIIPTNLLNTELFYADAGIDHSNSIISFMDGITSLSDDIMQYLYPNSNLPIKLFNNTNIKHPQNLGLINEQDKANLLRSYKYYLTISDNDEYIEEAKYSGCNIITLSTLNNYKNSIYLPASPYITYVDFIKDNILV